LKKNNILHTIKIVNSGFKSAVNYNFLYEEYIEKFNVYKTYFRRDGVGYGRNKILRCFELYIQVYKGFINLHQRKYLYQNSDVEIEIERPKYGVYIWPTYPYIVT